MARSALVSAAAAVAVFLILAVLVQDGFAAASLERVQEYPGHPRECLDRDLETFFRNGASWDIPGQCVRRQCVFPFITTHTCGSVIVEPPCELESDYSKPYPACCPQPRCPQENLETNDI